MEQIDSHWVDFHEIWYLSILQNSVGKMQVPLIYDMNNGYFTWRPIYIFHHISLHSSYNDKFFDKTCRENQNILYVRYCFCKIVSSARQGEKILMSRTGNRWEYGACTLHTGYLRLQTQSECVITFASPLRQWLQEGAYLIRCAYIACPVIVRSMAFLYSRLCLRTPF
jgi:hypothetical protein